jgi:hypothetical protein
LPWQRRRQSTRDLKSEQEAKERAQGLARVFAGLSGLPARKAAERLNAEGVSTPEGGKWHGAQVSRVRSRLAGLMRPGCRFRSAADMKR